MLFTAFDAEAVLEQLCSWCLLQRLCAGAALPTAVPCTGPPTETSLCTGQDVDQQLPRLRRSRLTVPPHPDGIKVCPLPS